MPSTRLVVQYQTASLSGPAKTNAHEMAKPGAFAPRFNTICLRFFYAGSCGSKTIPSDNLMSRLSVHAKPLLFC
jgi:hypothetical protein